MPLLFIALLTALPEATPDAVVVCSPQFEQALHPLIEYRKKQGHSFAMISNTLNGEQIRNEIRSLARSGKLKYILIVGDATVSPKSANANDPTCVPVHRAKAKVNVSWGSEPHIATDNYYADLDDDHIPDVAIGRLTADTPKELREMVNKILTYERSDDVGLWRQRLNFVAGTGGFGQMIDSVLEASSQYMLSQDIPASYTVNMTYGNWQSAYCPDPRRFQETTIERLNEGCWFWVYIGHGFPYGLDRLCVPKARYQILTNANIPQLQCRHGLPIAVFLACYTGAFDATQDCLAEQMLRTPGAPVAIIAASRIAMPYAMSVFGTGLLEECFCARRKTIGEAILHAKKKMLQSGKKTKRRDMLDAIASVVSPTPSKMAEELAEHLLLFNLLGDPMLRLRHPHQVKVKVASKAVPGQSLKISAESPIDGRATVELARSRSQQATVSTARSKYPTNPEKLSNFQNDYLMANDHRLESTECTVENGQLNATLKVPDRANGDCHIRVFVEGSNDMALGSADVEITDPK